MSNILYGKDLRGEIATAVGGCGLTVTDDRVAELYPELCAGAFIIPQGEKSKTPEVLLSVLAEMQRRSLKREDRIAAVGGGVVGDITGLAAALYMRGIEWLSVPTTLLSMVDSGFGGKTAVNFGGEKNLIGAFHKPVRTIISYDFLETLYAEEWTCGYGEMIKMCLLSAEAYGLLKSNLDAIIDYDREAVYALIEMCIRIKEAVVAADPKEKNMRKILNVGHTVGHALEVSDGFKQTHGEYVLKGMMTECAMCRDLMDNAYCNELIAIFRRFVSPPRTGAQTVLKHVLRDKKNVGDTVTVMLPIAPGEILDVKIARRDFAERYERALKELKRT